MSMLFKRIKDWATSITSFRTGDVIPVDGPDGTAKMSKDDLLRETADNTLSSIKSIGSDATEADLKAGNYFALDGAEGTKRLPAEAVAKGSVYSIKSGNVNATAGSVCSANDLVPGLSIQAGKKIYIRINCNPAGGIPTLQLRLNGSYYQNIPAAKFGTWLEYTFTSDAARLGVYVNAGNVLQNSNVVMDVKYGYVADDISELSADLNEKITNVSNELNGKAPVAAGTDEIHSIADEASDVDITAGNYFVLDGLNGRKKLPAQMLALTKTERVLNLEENEENGFMDYTIGGSLSFGSQSYWKHTFVEVAENEIVNVKTTLGANGRKGYVVFVDENEIVLADYIRNNSSETKIKEDTIVVPSGAVKMYIMSFSSGVSTTWSADILQIKSLKNVVKDHDERIENLEKDVPAYYKENDYIDGKVNVIRSNTPVKKGVSFYFFTDIHFHERKNKSFDIVNYITDRTSVPFGFFGGDIVEAYGDESKVKDNAAEWQEYVRNLKTPIFSCHGNHDFTIKENSSSSIGFTCTPNQARDWLRVDVGDYRQIIPYADKNYYEVKIESQKLSILVVDTYEKFTPGTGAYHVETFISEQQFDWIVSRFNAYENWNFIIVCHATGDSSIIGYNEDLRKRVWSLFKALNKKEGYSIYIYDPSIGDFVLKKGTFAGSTNNVICTIAGHNHRDESHLDTDGNLLSVTCTSMYPYNDDPNISRSWGSVTEYAISVFSFDTEERTIKQVRIGGGNNREFTF